jgi:hypothetical protein
MVPRGGTSKRRGVTDRVAIAALLAAVVALAGARPAAAAQDPAKALALRYSPVVRLVAQSEPCAHGEPYEPTNVNLVLRNPGVALHGPWNTSNIVKVAPTARDLSNGLFEYHLDFPGSALNPKCTYDTWSHAITKGSQPVAYARVVTDRAHPDQVALQYWFFYVFNDFNDKHEGDWEMIQLDFPAGSAARALKTKPSEVGYSQHEGAESAKWGDEKLRLVGGTHPVVYPALGSHANYYGSNLYLGRSAAQGVGCDDTTGPSRELRPVVALVPTDRAAYLRAYPWLGFIGHWGEQHSGFYNGPTGPNTKQQWTEPITWADEHFRDRSFTVPSGGSVGSTATGFFCGAVATGSSLLTSITGNPSPVLIGFAVLAVLMLWLASRTTWQATTPVPVRRRRRWGTIVATSARLYVSHLRLVLGLGVLFIPLGLLITGAQYLLFRVSGLSSLVDTAGASNAVVGGLAILLGTLLTVFGLGIIQAAGAVSVSSLDSEREAGPLDAYRVVLARWRPLLGAFAVAVAVVLVLPLSTIGVIIAVFLVVRWSFLAQAIVLEGASVRGAFRRSSELVRGSWWRVASLALFVAVIAVVLGPLLGAVILFVTSASFNFVNLISSLVYVFTLPFVAVATTYLYFDLALEKEEAEPVSVPASSPA